MTALRTNKTVPCDGAAFRQQNRLLLRPPHLVAGPKIEVRPLYPHEQVAFNDDPFDLRIKRDRAIRRARFAQGGR